MKDKEGLGKIFEDSLLEEEARDETGTLIDAKSRHVQELEPVTKLHGQTVGLPKETQSSLTEAV